MEHFFIDRFAHRAGLYQRLDPRVRLVVALTSVLFILFTPAPAGTRFAAYFVLLLCLVALARLPLGFVFKRSLAVIPFVALVAVSTPFGHRSPVTGPVFLVWQAPPSPYWTAAGVVAKAWLSVLVLVVLSASTNFTSLLAGLQRMKLPGVLIMTLSFMYRYFFVLVDEAMRIERARALRSFGRRLRLQIQALANSVALLFVRSYERAERVYAAMCARGFDGRVRALDTLHLRFGDGVFLVITLGLLVAIHCVL